MLKITHRTQLVDLLIDLKLPLTAALIGIAEGYDSEDLLKGGLQKLYMVDNWATIAGQQGDGGHPQEWHDKNFADALHRVSPYADKIKILRGMSVEMSRQVEDNSLGLVYFDGDHSLEGMRADLSAWFPKVCHGGIIAGHDYLNMSYGVWDAVYEFTKGLYEVHVIHEDKPEDAGFYFIKK